MGKIEIGSLKMEWGKAAGNSAPAMPPVSPDQVDAIEKALPPGASVNRAGTEAIRAQAANMGASAPVAAGEPPSPGNLPAVTTEASPLRFQFPYGYNQTITTRRGRSTPFQTLRDLAKVSDLIRICIETRKDQMSSLNWDIVPRDKKRATDAKTQRAIETAKAIFRKPDRLRPFQTWLRLAIEEVMVIDALSIFRRRTRGGDLWSLEIIDGSTIVPLVDGRGETPIAPNVAYRQIINGQAVKGGDCTVEQLLYRPRTVSSDSPYGLSPTEAVLLAVNAALNRQVFNLAHYSEGNIPRALMEGPEGYTPAQLRELQGFMDELLSGNLGARSRVRVVGKGGATGFKQLVEPNFDTKWDEWLLKIVCAAFAVPPQEIGFTGDVNKATGQMQENVVYRRGVKPLMAFFSELFNEVLEADLVMPELQFVFTGGEPEDKLVQAQTDEIYLRRGKVSVDDLRARDGQDLIGIGPMIDTPMGPVPVKELLAGPVDGDPDTSEIEIDQAGQPAAAAAAPAVDDTDPESREPVTEEDLEDEARKDLTAWKRLAIKAVKASQTPKHFTSDFLPADTKLEIRLGLRKATSVDDVAKLFERFDTPAALLPIDARGRAVSVEKGEYRVLRGKATSTKRRIHSVMKKHFIAEGKAIAAALKGALPQ